MRNCLTLVDCFWSEIRSSGPGIAKEVHLLWVYHSPVGRLLSRAWSSTLQATHFLAYKLTTPTSLVLRHLLPRVRSTQLRPDHRVRLTLIVAVIAWTLIMRELRFCLVRAFLCQRLPRDIGMLVFWIDRIREILWSMVRETRIVAVSSNR